MSGLARSPLLAPLVALLSVAGLILSVILAFQLNPPFPDWLWAVYRGVIYVWPLVIAGALAVVMRRIWLAGGWKRLAGAVIGLAALALSSWLAYWMYTFDFYAG